MRTIKAPRAAIRRSRLSLLLSALLLSFFLYTIQFGASAGEGDDCEVFGRVEDGEGPVSAAIVRLQTTAFSTRTRPDGSFRLRLPQALRHLRLTAWAPGYYNALGDHDLSRLDEAITIRLTRHADRDHPEYEWSRATAASGGTSFACSQCHSRGRPADPPDLPYDQWATDAHSRTAYNERFLTMYFGTDVQGHRSPATKRVYTRDYGPLPLPPNPSEPYFGPGYRLDFPGTTGNCGACHLPLAAINNPDGADPRALDDTAKEGVSCDFCHKVWDVKVDVKTGMPLENMPGVLSFELRRPPAGHQFFAGPLDDVTAGEDTFSPLYRESRYCAPCHFGLFWETPIYNSYGEWLQSAYSKPGTGKTCQDCHMPPATAIHFVLPDKGGLERHPGSFKEHRMLGAGDESFLREAVRMRVQTERGNGRLTVRVEIVNEKAGHSVPTDSPLRQMILIVMATGADGRDLTLLEGSVVDESGGVGERVRGFYEGVPGKIFAKVLEERWTGLRPTGAYWNPTRIVSDNRIAPFACDSSDYVFECEGAAPAGVDVRLIFRRAPKTLMLQKGWDTADIPMARQVLTVPADAEASMDGPGK